MSTAALQGDERLPLYQRLADSLRKEIVDGVRSPGDQLPSENVLAEEYGLAPGTARQALARLVGEGILERFHGKGTFVRRPSFDQSLSRFFRFRAADGDLVIPESRILKRTIETADDSVASHLGLKDDRTCIVMQRLRVIDGTPVVAEEIWLPFDRFHKFMEIGDADVGPLLYPVYATQCGQVIAHASEELRVEAVEPDAAKVLGLASGDPVIVIDRLAFGFDNKPLEWRRSRGRAAQFYYHTEIR